MFRKNGRRSRVKPRPLPLLAIIEFRMGGRDHRNDPNTLSQTQNTDVMFLFVNRTVIWNDGGYQWTERITKNFANETPSCWNPGQLSSSHNWSTSSSQLVRGVSCRRPANNNIRKESRCQWQRGGAPFEDHTEM